MAELPTSQYCGDGFKFVTSVSSVPALLTRSVVCCLRQLGCGPAAAVQLLEHVLRPAVRLAVAAGGQPAGRPEAAQPALL